MKKLVSVLAGAAAVAATGFGLSGCTTAVPALSECAATTNGGFGSNGQGITSIVHPGGQAQVGNGDTAWYWPCNERNFVTATTDGDRSAPEYAVRTGAAGSTPGMPVYVWTSVYFTANQNDAAIKAFLPFCFKYGCADTSPQDSSDIEDSAHSSSPGWEKMLLENMGPAIDRASQTAVQQFGPNLWQSQGDWDKLSSLIAGSLNKELTVETGSATPFFCGDDSTETNCLPMTVVVNNVTPSDPSVVTNYNKEVAAEQAAAANAARVAQAKLLYGPYSGYFLGIQDSSQLCPKCTFIIGTPPTAAAAR